MGPGPIIMGPGMPCIIGYGPMGIMGYGPMAGNPGRNGGKPMGPDIPMDMFRFPFIISGGPSLSRMPAGGLMNPGPFGGALEAGRPGPRPRPMPGLGGAGPLEGGSLPRGAEEGGGPVGGGLAPLGRAVVKTLLLLPMLEADWPLLGPFSAFACAICPSAAETASVAAFSAAALVLTACLMMVNGGPPVKDMALSDPPVRAMAEPVSSRGAGLGGGAGGRWAGKGLELWLVLGGPAEAFIMPCIQQLSFLWHSHCMIRLILCYVHMQLMITSTVLFSARLCRQLTAGQLCHCEFT